MRLAPLVLVILSAAPACRVPAGLGRARGHVSIACAPRVPARDRGARAIYLETGAQPSFAAARALYLRAGFALCPPFAQYREDPNSAFMVLDLRA